MIRKAVQLLKKMREEEEEHGNNAKNAGARNLPIAIRKINAINFKSNDKDCLLDLVNLLTCFRYFQFHCGNSICIIIAFKNC